MPAGGTNGRAYEAPTSSGSDTTETALIGLIRQSMEDNTRVTRDGFERMGEGMDKMAASMKTLFRVLGIAFLLMTAGLISIVGYGVHLKFAGSEFDTTHTASRAFESEH